MRISIIAIIGVESVINNQNITQFKYPPSYIKYFNIETDGKLLVIGRTTYENICTFIKKPLGATFPNKKIIILSKKPCLEYIQNNEDVFQAISVDNAIQIAQQLCAREIIVTGGKSTHQLFFPIADKLYIIHPFGNFQCNTYFPKFISKEWRSIFRKCKESSWKIPYDIGLKTLERTKRDSCDMKEITLNQFSV